MRNLLYYVVTGVWVAAVFASCGAGRGPRTASPLMETMPPRVGSTGWIRQPETARYVGDSLFEYIDGAAEMYHKYDFVEVEVAEYNRGKDAVTAEVYTFADAARAYGMYGTLRPDEPDTVALGVEGFMLGANLVFVKGSYIAGVYSYDETEEALSGVRSVAALIEGGLPGSGEKPGMFGLLPGQGRIGFTEKIYAESFLGQGFLTDVYTADYSFEGDRLTLFISDDPAGVKLRRWSESIGVDEDRSVDVAQLPLETGVAIFIVDPYHGPVLAGTKASWLVGAVGYSNRHRGFMVAWLSSL